MLFAANQILNGFKILNKDRILGDMVPNHLKKRKEEQTKTKKECVLPPAIIKGIGS